MAKRTSEGKILWSGAFPKGEVYGVKGQRFDTYNAMQNAEIDGVRVRWRKFFGDALVAAQNQITETELLRLLTLEDYINQESYIEISVGLGLTEEEAKKNYFELMVNKEGI